MSNLKLKASISNIESALDFLGGRTERKLGHNTYVKTDDGHRVHILYHGNIIVTFYRQEVGYYTEYLLELPPVAVFSDAGWATVTTARRLHMILTDVTERYNDPAIHHAIGISQGETEWRQFWTDLDGTGRKPIRTPFGGKSLAVFASGHVRMTAGARLTVA